MNELAELFTKAAVENVIRTEYLVFDKQGNVVLSLDVEGTVCNSLAKNLPLSILKMNSERLSDHFKFIRLTM
jgi:hypothetical protein